MHDDRDPGSISDNKIQSIAEDANGNLIIGTHGGGLNFFNKKTKKFKSFVHADNKNSIANDNVNCIFEDKFQNLWIATMEKECFYCLHFQRWPSKQCSVWHTGR
jgi:ligand-binding sensor domain-containing protein